MTLTKLTAGEITRRMDRGERFAFVDARTLEELNESDGRLPGAIRMTAPEVAQLIRAVPQGMAIVTYCTCRNEESSTEVALELMRWGFLNVFPLIGGLDAWRKAGGPIESIKER
jgi:rhodanese-related sulfurtransferase